MNLLRSTVCFIYDWMVIKVYKQRNYVHMK